MLLSSNIQTQIFLFHYYQGRRHWFESGGGQSLRAKQATQFCACTPHFSQCGGYKKLKSQNISKPKHNTIGAQPWFQSWEVGPARGGCRSLLQRGPWRARKHASSYKGVWGLWPPVGSRGLPLHGRGGVRGLRHLKLTAFQHDYTTHVI